MTEQITDRGSYLELDGRPAVRFERTYPHDVDRVWHGVTDPAELAHWFPSAVRYDARTGGTIRFAEDPYSEDGAGTVLDWDPPHRFAFTWGDDEVHLELSGTDGGCRLVLINVLSARDTAARNAAGWHVCLAELDKALGGSPGDGPHSETTLPWQPVLDAYVAAGLPAGAPVPDVP